jgi:V-type H+-transporting ATPase subunit G
MATGDGIQKLLAAETAAGQIVAEARKVRAYAPGGWPTVAAKSFAVSLLTCFISSCTQSRTKHSTPTTTPPLNQKQQAKQERLRQAKAEAEREIGAYKAEREAAYQRKLSEATSGAAAAADRMRAETEAAIAQVQKDVSAAKKGVVDMLVKYATTVEL